VNEWDTQRHLHEGSAPAEELVARAEKAAAEARQAFQILARHVDQLQDLGDGSAEVFYTVARDGIARELERVQASAATAYDLGGRALQRLESLLVRTVQVGEGLRMLKERAARLVRAMEYVQAGVLPPGGDDATLFAERDDDGEGEDADADETE
jgi:hypothetical protein